jgi:hypothetical protein
MAAFLKSKTYEEIKKQAPDLQADNATRPGACAFPWQTLPALHWERGLRKWTPPFWLPRSSR